MKKIGIVTWYDSGHNYGSTLQAFATQSYLEEKGYDCELINYKPEKKKIKKKIKEMLKRLYLLIFNYKIFKSWKKMEKWIKNNVKQSKLITSYEDLKEYSKKYDAVICGSDQIWNNANNKVNPFYYLQFVDKEKRIAYAPSIARDYIDDTIRDEFSNYVKEIKCLSIREEKGAELIEKVTGRKAEVVIDPTFLLDKQTWQKVAKINENNENSEKYILVYFLTQNEEHYKQVEKISKERNIKIVTIPVVHDKNQLSVIANHSDFLSLIKNAEYVVTDSFHGVAFSINFEKKFVAYKRFKDNFKQTQNSRIYNILRKLDLNDRLVTEENTIEKIFDNDINYIEVKNKLGEMIKKSQNYLLTSIDNVINNK